MIETLIMLKIIVSGFVHEPQESIFNTNIMFNIVKVFYYKN